MLSMQRQCRRLGKGLMTVNISRDVEMWFETKRLLQVGNLTKNV
jgi:anti-anti-sigma regulatory factor